MHGFLRQSGGSGSHTLIAMSKVPPFEPDKEGPEYVYIRFADYIEAGELRPGHRLAAEKDLAEKYGIAYHSVRRAMQELRERGLIQTVPGRGTYVARRDENADDQDDQDDQ